MAHYEKYTKVQLGHVCNHDKRIEGDGIQRSNENIDSSRTYQNYLIGGHKDATEFIKRRLSEVRHLNRDDVVQMCSCIVTIPKDYTGDERDFFHSTYEFLKAVHGEQNIVSAWVHKDEVTPHLHFKFIPIVEDGKNGGEKLCCKEVLTRRYLREFHKKLQEHLEKDLGVPCNVLNGATENGNRTVQGLKAESLSKENEKAEQELHQKQEQALAYDLSSPKRFTETKEAYEERQRVHQMKVALEEEKKAFGERVLNYDTEVHTKAVELAKQLTVQRLEDERDKYKGQAEREAQRALELERNNKDLKKQRENVINENDELMRYMDNIRFSDGETALDKFENAHKAPKKNRGMER